MVSRSSSDEGLRLHLRLRQDLPNCLLEGGVGALELATDELVVGEHQNSGCLVSQRASCPEVLGGRTLWYLVVYEQVRDLHYGKRTAKGRAVSIRSITIQVFPINGAREEPASRKAMISAMRCKCGWDLRYQAKPGLLGYYQSVSSQGALSINGDNHGDGKGGLVQRAKVHFHPSISRLAAQKGLRLVYVPAKMTSFLQPCDTHLFSIFKHTLQESWRRRKSEVLGGVVSTQDWVSVICNTVEKGCGWPVLAASFPARRCFTPATVLV